MQPDAIKWERLIPQVCRLYGANLRRRPLLADYEGTKPRALSGRGALLSSALLRRQAVSMKRV